jgi:hemerythrin superfamily protein
MNAIELLKNDHKKVRALFAELEATTPRALKKRASLLDKIASELEIHTRIEEEIFYPAFKQAGQKSEDDKMYFEALEEHRAAGDMVLPDLLATDPGSDQFSGRAKVLKELVEHHAGEEEKQMFPRARQLLDAGQLRALGEAMAQRKLELAAHPISKAAEAADKMIGAVVSAISPMDDSRTGEGRSSVRH